MSRSVAFSSSIFFFIIVGCNFEPRYHAPLVQTPSEWKTEQDQAEELPPVDFWWEVFEDSTLNSLEQFAVNNNYTLQMAAERVIQARDFANIARSKLYPHINLLPAYSNQDILTKLFGKKTSSLPNQNGSGILSSSSGQDPRTLIREHQLLYALPLCLSYEVDLWGKLRGRYRAAVLEVIAQDKSFKSALLILTTDLAATYFQLRTQDSLIDLYVKIIGTRKKELEINRSRYESRVSDYSAVAQAEFELTNVEALLQAAQRQRVILEDQIAVYIGVPASTFTLEGQALSGSPPVIPAGLPSEILLQRPDLAEQEYLMASIHQQIGVAYASYFPAIELTAGLGFSSPVSSEFMKWKSRSWGFGTDISQFVFDAGARDANVEMTWSQFREAAFAYQQRVLVAFEEVEDALSNLEMITREMETIKRSVSAAHHAYVIALDRYRQGLTYYTEVVVDERQELESEQMLASLLGLRYVNTVQLIKAIGGSWSCGS